MRRGIMSESIKTQIIRQDEKCKQWRQFMMLKCKHFTHCLQPFRFLCLQNIFCCPASNSCEILSRKEIARCKTIFRLSSLWCFPTDAILQSGGWCVFVFVFVCMSSKKIAVSPLMLPCWRNSPKWWLVYIRRYGGQGKYIPVRPVHSIFFGEWCLPSIKDIKVKLKKMLVS